MRYLAFLTLFLVMACASTSSRAYSSNQDYNRNPTLLVNNESGAHVSIYLNGQKLGVATSGENCFGLMSVQHGAVDVAVRATAGERHHTEIDPNLRRYSGWKLDLLGTYRFNLDLLSLEPAARCK